MIYTDALQTLIMLIGALTLMGYSKWGPRVTWVDDSTSLKQGRVPSALRISRLSCQKHTTWVSPVLWLRIVLEENCAHDGNTLFF